MMIQKAMIQLKDGGYPQLFMVGIVQVGIVQAGKSCGAGEGGGGGGSTKKTV